MVGNAEEGKVNSFGDDARGSLHGADKQAFLGAIGEAGERARERDRGAQEQIRP